MMVLQDIALGVGALARGTANMLRLAEQAPKIDLCEIKTIGAYAKGLLHLEIQLWSHMMHLAR
jgi:hypothetical protein